MILFMIIIYKVYPKKCSKSRLHFRNIKLSLRNKGFSDANCGPLISCNDCILWIGWTYVRVKWTSLNESRSRSRRLTFFLIHVSSGRVVSVDEFAIDVYELICIMNCELRWTFRVPMSSDSLNFLQLRSDRIGSNF